MAGFLTDFLSLGSGALAGQALYFLFVKYPYELRRNEAELDVAARQLELGSAAWTETFDVFGEAYEFVSAFLGAWKGVADFVERTKVRREIEKRLWSVKALYRVEGEPMARTLELFEGVLGEILEALSKGHKPALEERIAINEHVIAINRSVKAIEQVENAKVILNKANAGGIKNELISVKTLCLWSRVGLFLYGILIAAASAMDVSRSRLRFHSSLAYADAILVVAVTIAVLSYSFYQERNLVELMRTKGRGMNA